MRLLILTGYFLYIKKRAVKLILLAKSKILDCLAFDCDRAGITLLSGWRHTLLENCDKMEKLQEMHSFALSKSVSAAGKCLKPVQREQ